MLLLSNASYHGAYARHKAQSIRFVRSVVARLMMENDVGPERIIKGAGCTVNIQMRPDGSYKRYWHIYVHVIWQHGEYSLYTGMLR